MIVCVFPSRALIQLMVARALIELMLQLEPFGGIIMLLNLAALNSAPVLLREMLKYKIFLTVRKENRHTVLNEMMGFSHSKVGHPGI